MRFFGTLFNKHYINRGVTLLSSLRSHVVDFKLFILCLDDFTYDYIVKGQNIYPEIVPIPITVLEQENALLINAKKNRSLVEYFFTLSPVLPNYILKNFSEVNIITTLDADIFFYSSLEPIYQEFEGNSILITPHKFTNRLKYKEQYGLYNVSFQMFRRDINGLQCLKEWEDQCLEWCFDKLEGNKFADQKYLDEWKRKFDGVKVLSNIGAALAPWNLNSYELRFINDKLYINNDPLIFYHFHGLKKACAFISLNGLDEYLTTVTPTILKYLYKPYILQLEQNTPKNSEERNIRKSLSIKDILSKIAKGGSFIFFNKLNRIIYIKLK